MPSSPKARGNKPAKEPASSGASSSRRKQSTGRISAACEACKRRKTKCTGGPPPCQLCESLGTECIIDLSLDMRRRAALQRTIDESKTNQEALHSLVTYIRQEGPSCFDSLLELIRGDPSSQEIIRFTQGRRNPSIDAQGSEESGDQENAPETSFTDQLDQMQLQQGLLSNKYSTPVDPEILRPEVDGIVSSPDKGKSREADSQGHVQKILHLLRTSSLVDAEVLLRQLMSNVGRDRSSYTQFMLDNESTASWQSSHIFNPDNEVPSQSFSGVVSPERTSWHPALQIQDPHGPFDSYRPGYAGMSNLESSGELYRPSGPHRPFVQQAMNVPQTPTTLALQSYVSIPHFSRNNFETHPTSNIAYQSLADQDLCVAQEGQPLQYRIPIHLVQPLVIADESFLSRFYTDYVRGARHLLLNGIASSSDIIGTNHDVIVDLFFRDRLPNDIFSCSNWASELGRSFVDMDQYFRLANVYLLAMMMRWLLVPTRENYAILPNLVKLTPSQRLVPHIGAIELCVLPAVRDAAIHKLRDWLTPMAQSNCSVNWPYSMNEALEQVPGSGSGSGSGSTRLTQRFIEHVCRSENWSVGSRFLFAFPEVAGHIRIHD